MADFDAAARRLAADQSRLRSRARLRAVGRPGGGYGNSGGSGGGGGGGSKGKGTTATNSRPMSSLSSSSTTFLSARARREADQVRRKDEERRAEREKRRRKERFAVRYMVRMDRELGVVRSLSAVSSSSSSSSSSMLTTTKTMNGAGPTMDEANDVAVVVGGGGIKSGGPTPRSSPLSPSVTWAGASNDADDDDGQAAGRLMLRPTSVHGDGDKIALPPSVLAVLAESGMMEEQERMRMRMRRQQQQPLTFRIGLLRDGYAFPSSDAMREMMEKASVAGEDGEDDDDDDIDDMDVDGTQANGDKAPREYDIDDFYLPPPRTRPYLSELSHRYVSYAHGTVVEFTQDDGCVGLPASISEALLNPANRKNIVTEQDDSGSARGDDIDGGEGKGTGAVAGAAAAAGTTVVIPRTRTIDPASVPRISDGDGNDGTSDAKDEIGNDSAEQRTPGHPAYGLFDVPSDRVEVTLVRLPLGKRCKLIPTAESVRKGFYNLKDVKLVLEQSLVRTRATLSVGDVVYAWHRGTRFELRVDGVLPSDWGAVSCVNTDIEVDIAPLVSEKNEETATVSKTKAMAEGSYGNKFAPGRGRRLIDDLGGNANGAMTSTSTTGASSATSSSSSTDPSSRSRVFPPEPTPDRTDGVCAVRIRGDGVAGMRRFISSETTMADVFAYASFLLFGTDVGGGEAFRLVTRFPRRVFTLDGCGNMTLDDAGIGAQEAFMVERT